MLLVPASHDFLEPLEAFRSGLVVGVEAVAVYPHLRSGRSWLDAYDLVCAAVQEDPIMTYEQDRLVGVAQASFEPQLPRYVQIIVRLVQQQDFVSPAEERLKHEPLLLTA